MGRYRERQPIRDRKAARVTMGQEDIQQPLLSCWRLRVKCESADLQWAPLWARPHALLMFTPRSLTRFSHGIREKNPAVVVKTSQTFRFLQAQPAKDTIALEPEHPGFYARLTPVVEGEIREASLRMTIELSWPLAHPSQGGGDGLCLHNIGGTREQKICG